VHPKFRGSHHSLALQTSYKKVMKEKQLKYVHGYILSTNTASINRSKKIGSIFYGKHACLLIELSSYGRNQPHFPAVRVDTGTSFVICETHQAKIEQFNFILNIMEKEMKCLWIFEN
jgi:hypothetical protein